MRPRTPWSTAGTGSCGCSGGHRSTARSCPRTGTSPSCSQLGFWRGQRTEGSCGPSGRRRGRYLPTPLLGASSRTAGGTRSSRACGSACQWCRGRQAPSNITMHSHWWPVLGWPSR
uniref:Uncharacterized protein n=1 Tax=Arundo donax TaxID=35708 RepID=A0A0A9B3G3_ARUDO